MKRLIIFILLGIASFDAGSAPPPITTQPVVVNPTTKAFTPTTGTDGQVMRVSGSTLALGTIATAGIATDAVTTAKILAANVTYAKIQNVAGLSIFGRSANTSGVGADITGVDGQALRVSGTTLGFGTILAAGIASDAVTTVKILDANVTYAKFQNVAGLSVMGRSANSSGVGADITGVDGQVLRVSGTTLGFGTIATAGIADGSITLAKMANATAHSIIGNFTGSSAVPSYNVVGTGVDAFLLDPTSAKLATAVTDETGTAGSLVFSVSPAITGTMTAQAITMTGDLNLAAATAVKYNGQNVIRANTTLGNYFFGPTGNLTATGTNNVGVGVNTMGSITTGIFNAAIGYSALNNLTTGSDNLGLGAFAGTNINTGASNCAFGSSALVSLTSGSTNSAFGRESLTGLTNGSANTAMGKDCIRDVTTGGNNTAVGTGTGRGITTGSNNTIIGANVTGLTAALANTVVISDGQGHYYTTTISSTGVTTFDAIGSAAEFRFNDSIGLANIPSGSPTPAPAAGFGKFYVEAGAFKYVSPSDGVGGPHVTTIANQ